VLQFQTSSNDPLGLAIDSTGKIYTANQTGSDLLIYNADGTSAGTIVTGGGPQYPAIAPNGNIWTSTSTNADGPHGSVEAFTPGGTRVATVTAGLYGPYGVAVDQSGKVYVANNGGGNVTTYTGSGTQTTPTISINSAFALAVGPNGKIYVVNGNGLSVYNADGSASTPSITGSFYSVAVDRAGNIYLLDLITAFPSGNTTCFEYMYSASGVQIGSDFTVSNHCDGIAVH
jgi:sugar lactone lactonase YvrE